jgi:hypothetical protein
MNRNIVLKLLLHLFFVGLIAQQNHARTECLCLDELQRGHIHSILEQVLPLPCPDFFRHIVADEGRLLLLWRFHDAVHGQKLGYDYFSYAISPTAESNHTVVL